LSALRERLYVVRLFIGFKLIGYDYAVGDSAFHHQK